jgi:hypothetical protein
VDSNYLREKGEWSDNSDLPGFHFAIYLSRHANHRYRRESLAPDAAPCRFFGKGFSLLNSQPTSTQRGKIAPSVT